MREEEIVIEKTDITWVMGGCDEWTNVPGILAKHAALLNHPDVSVEECEAVLNSLGNGYAYKVTPGIEDAVSFTKTMTVISVIERALLENGVAQVANKARGKA